MADIFEPRFLLASLHIEAILKVLRLLDGEKHLSQLKMAQG